MTSQLGERREKRVAYYATVHLSPATGGTQFSGDVANLSMAGAGLKVSQRCRKDSELFCELSLAEQSRRLKGRVAWVANGAAGMAAEEGEEAQRSDVGMGIQFIDLKSGDEDWLRSNLPELAAVTEAGQGDAEGASDSDADDASDNDEARSAVARDREGPIVDVTFAGSGQKIQAQAIKGEAGYRLRTSLPFLHLDAALSVDERDGAAQGKRLFLRNVELTLSGDHIPWLTLEVSDEPTQDADAADLATRAGEGASLDSLAVEDGEAETEWLDSEDGWERTEVMGQAPAAWIEEYGHAPEEDDPGEWLIDSKPQSEPAVYDRFWREVARSRRRRIVYWSAAAALACVVTVAALVVSQWGSTKDVWAGSAQGRDRSRLVAGSAADAQESKAEPSKARAAVPICSNRSAGADCASLSRPARAKRASAMETPKAARKGQPAAAPQPKRSGRPKLSIAGENATLTIPVHADLHNSGGLEHYRLSSPVGIALNLPGHATPAVPARTYRYNRHGLRHVWVRDLETSGQIRVFFEERVPPYELVFQESAIRLTFPLPAAKQAPST